MENIYIPRANQFSEVDQDDIVDIFEPGKYTNTKKILDRYRNSNYPTFWNLVEHVTLGGPSSTNDNIKAAGIAASEYHAADVTDSRITSTKTNGGGHGTVWYLENTAWEGNDQQNVYVIETDPNRDKQIYDFEKLGTYPENAVFTDKPVEPWVRTAWESFAREDADVSYENINVDLRGKEEFVEAIKNTGEYGLKKYTLLSIVMSNIDKEAHPDGEHPELEGAYFTAYLGEGNIEFEKRETRTENQFSYLFE